MHATRNRMLQIVLQKLLQTVVAANGPNTECTHVKAFLKMKMKKKMLTYCASHHLMTNTTIYIIVIFDNLLDFQ